MLVRMWGKKASYSTVGGNVNYYNRLEAYMKIPKVTENRYAT